jgi:hypothetical protein
MGRQEPIDMVEVRVGRKKIFMPKTMTPGDEIRRKGGIPSDRCLVVQSGDRREIVRDTDLIEVRPGLTFDDIPRYEAGSQNYRLMTEVYALRMAYPRVTYDEDRFLWVCIHDFDLPPGFNKKQGELLIELNANYPFTPPKNFFLDRTVKTGRGESIEHYYPDEQYNKYHDRGWAWFCVHIKTWKVRGDIMQSDNLLTAADLAYLTLQDVITNN